jgi:hypothetical protein
MENLGKLGRDKVTGYEGVITAKANHLYGCDTYYLTAKAKDNKKEDSGNGWYDVGRIEVLETAVTPEEVKSEKPGGEQLTNPDNLVD